MTEAIYWFGALHVAIYAVAGASLASAWLLSKAADWSGHSVLILQAVWRIIKERDAEKRKEFHGA